MSVRVVTAAELEAMGPAERRAIFAASIVTDLDEAPQHLIDRARARVEQRIVEAEVQDG
ncbi:hypothetical protein BH24ACT5_BH24ACT5_14960 [soil metagenome]